MPDGNVAPTPVCNESVSITTKKSSPFNTALVPIGLASSSVSKSGSGSVTTLVASYLMVGPTQYCAGYGPGAGLGSCMQISKGCWASMPLDNVVPVTTCNGSIPAKTGLDINGTIYPATRYGNGSLVPITTGSATFDASLVPTSYSEPWYNTSSIDAGFNSIFPTNTSTLFPYSPLPTATSGLKNYSSYVDACYSDWNWYYSWRAQNLPYNPDNYLQVNGTFLSTTTFISTWSEDMYAYTKDDTYSTTETYTTTESANGFAISTSTTTQSETFTESGLPPSDVKSLYTSTVTSTSFSESWITVSPSTKFPIRPSCKLPPVVSDCQSTWNAYESMVFSSLSLVGAKFGDCQQNWTNAECSSASSLWYVEEASYATNPTMWTTPPCTQASVGSGLCSHVRSAYMESWTLQNSGIRDYPGQVVDAGYITSFVDYTTTISGSKSYVEYESTYWPANSTMAPGCTLGCGGCAITGGTVQLIYWPEGTMAETAAPTLNQTTSSPVTVDPLSARQQRDSEIAVAFAFNTTFTSPTVYIRYGSLYASDSCSGLGKTYSNTYITLPNSDDLSSIWATYPYPMAHTAWFNYTDLNDPVPLSIYDRQPRCAEYTANNDPMTDVPNFSCPHDRPYEPILFVPSAILRSVDPSWVTCSGDVRGQYDPPYKLSKYSVAAEPQITPSAGAMPQPASPGSPLSSVTALMTSTPSPVPIDPGTHSSAQPPASALPHSSSSAVPGPSGPAGGISSLVGPQPSSTPASAPAYSSDPTVGGPSGPAGGIGSIIAQQPSSASASAAAPSQISAVEASSDPAGGIASIIATPPPSDPNVSPAYSSDPTAGDPSDPAGSIASMVAPPPSSAQAAAPVPAPAPASSVDPADPNGQAPATYASIVVDGNTIAADSSNSGNAVVGGQTNALGVAATVNGQPLSNHGAGTVVLGNGATASSVAVPSAAAGSDQGAPAPAQALTTVGGNPKSAVPVGSGIVIGASPGGNEQTLQPGKGATIANTPLSVNDAGSLVVGSGSAASTIKVPAAASPTPQPVAIVAGQPISAAPVGSGIVIGNGQTLGPGQGTDIANTPVSINSAGSLVLGQGPTASTIGLSAAAASPTLQAIATVGDQPISAAPAGSGVVISNGQTLAPGQGTEIANTPISVNSAGSLVLGQGPTASTINVPAVAASPAPLPVATVGGQPISAAAAGAGVILGNGQTLKSGQGTEIANTPISIDSAGSLVVGSGHGVSTIPVPYADPSRPIASAGGIPISAAPEVTPGAVAIGNDGTLLPGHATTIGGTRVSVDPVGSLIIGSGPGASTVAVPVGGSSAGGNEGAIITVGGQAYTAQPGAPLVIGGTTLSDGGSPGTFGGQVVSVGPSGVAVGGTDVPFSAISGPQQSDAVITVGGQAYTARPGQPIVIFGTTLSDGSPAATIDGQQVSVGPDGIQVGDSDIPFTAHASEPSAVFSIGGHTYTAGPGQPVVIDGTTVSPGGSLVTIDGQPVSLGSNGVVVGTSTIPFTRGVPASPEAVFSLGNQLVTAVDSSGHVVIGGTTLSAGGPALILSSETISVAPSGIGIVIDGSTEAFTTPTPPPTPGQAIPEVEAPFTLPDGQSLTAWEEAGHPGTVIIPNPTPGASPITLSVGGPATTINGQVISAGPSGVVVDGHLDPFETVTARAENEAAFTAPDGSLHSAIAEAGHSGTVVLDGSIALSIGDSGTMMDGESVSLGSSGLVLVSKGHTTTEPLSMVTEISSNGRMAIITGPEYASVGPWSINSSPSSDPGSAPSNTATADATSTKPDWGLVITVLCISSVLSIMLAD